MKTLASFVFALMMALAAGAAAAQSADLSWTNAAFNTDGTAIPATGTGSLTKSVVEYGSCSAPGVFGTKVNQIDVAAPGASVKVSPLVVQTYCFRVYHTNTYGSNSGYSNVATKTIAAPVPNPPTNLTVAALTAYTVVKRPDRFVMVAVGTVPAGTPCDASQSVNGFYAVPRAAVKWSGDVQPDVVVASCAG